MEQTTRTPSSSVNLRLVRHIQNSMIKLRNKQLQIFGLTASQSDVILYLLRNYQNVDEINQLDVQQYLQLSNPTVSGILSRLEDKNFISRTSSTKDARYKCILPTQKALSLNAVMKSHIESSEEAALRGLSDAERVELTRMLEIIRRNVDLELEKSDKF